MAHAIAPMANIDLFEASNDSNNMANLFTAVHTADNTPGVVVVSMSWDGDESIWSTAQIANYNSTDFSTRRATSAARPRWAARRLAGGITYFVASGDNGAYGDGSDISPAPEYPPRPPTWFPWAGRR